MGSGSKNGLFYSLLRDNSPAVSAKCMLRIAKLSSRWISNYGMSIGIGDVTPFPELLRLKQNLLNIGYKNCENLIE
jgi:DNA-directed RNA polymerase III subunit RPC1